MRTLYQWFTVTAVRSWYAHCLVCLIGSGLIGLLCSWFGLNGMTAMRWSATGLMAFYLWKEAGDELRYRASGTYRKRHWADKVKASTDRGGDTLGPIAVCATCWAQYIVSMVAFL